MRKQLLIDIADATRQLPQTDNDDPRLPVPRSTWSRRAAPLTENPAPNRDMPLRDIEAPSLMLASIDRDPPMRTTLRTEKADPRRA